jgi:divalent metal cation (Fe/Co/Zn/Cd) transporter
MIATTSLLARGRRLEYFTLGWNVIEAIVAGLAGLAAGSTALIGFALDSLIESLSGGVLLWRLRDGRDGEVRERIAQRLVAVSFVALAGYVAVESVLTLNSRSEPDASLVGIVLAAVSVIVMPILARSKRSVAAGLGSPALTADSRQTDLCAYLSAILLAGLGLNAFLGWWWADPVAALAMVPIMVFEARRAWRGDSCAC